MFDSYTEPAGFIQNCIRLLFSTLDRPAYAILGIIYELFFNVASADLFSNDLIMKFYGRVQIILGVIMMFHLAMTILRGIVNPDSFSKDKGAGSLISRVVTSLLLITLLMPISIPNARNEYEKQVNNNGLLFGTLYSLQHRILTNNTIGRLILGTSDSSTPFSVSEDGQDTELRKSARIFTSTILKGFYRINLIPEDQRNNTYLTEGKDPAVYNENRVCQDIDDEILAAYTRVDAEPGEILSMVTATCDSDASPSFINGITTTAQTLTGTTKYIFTYTPVVSTIVPIIFIFILLSFTIDIAVRAVKLAVLRLIAPIPIIAYMDPKGGNDTAFNAWIKTLVSTYLDLFIRLGSVYFVLYLIQDMIVNGITISTSAGHGFLHVLSMIIIWIGLFVFARQAPKFIKQVLGLKEDPGRLFGGFGELGAAFGLAAALPGAVGSGLASARASRKADEARQSLGETDMFGRQINPDGILNRGKHLVAGIAGGVMGGITGAGAAMSAKDHAFNASLEAMKKRNADIISRGVNGSTLVGRVQSTMSNVFTGEGVADSVAREIESNKSRIDALKAVKSRVSGEMVKKDWTYGSLGIQRDNAGNAIGNVNFKHFDAELAAGRSRGDGLVHFTDESGAAHTISLADAERQRGYLIKNNEDDYISRHVAGTVAVGDVDKRLMTLIHNAEVLGGSSDFVYQPDGTVEKGANKHITNRSSINDAIDGFEDYNTRLKSRNSINQANDRFSGGKK